MPESLSVSSEPSNQLAGERLQNETAILYKSNDRTEEVVMYATCLRMYYPCSSTHICTEYSPNASVQ